MSTENGCLVAMIISMVTNGDLDNLKVLVEREGKNILHKPFDGLTACQLAVHHSKVEILAYFVEELGFDVNERSMKYFTTPLELGLEEQSINCVEWMHKNVVFLEPPTTKIPEWYSKYRKILENIRSEIEVGIEGDRENDVLVMITQYKSLLGRSERNILYACIMKNAINCIKKIVKEYDVVNNFCIHRYPPFFVACMMEKREIADALIDAGADVSTEIMEWVPLESVYYNTFK